MEFLNWFSGELDFMSVEVVFFIMFVDVNFIGVLYFICIVVVYLC